MSARRAAATSRAAPGRAPGRGVAVDDRHAIVQGLRRMVKALEIHSQDVQRAYGLSGPQLWAVKTLDVQGPMFAGELAEALVVHQSSLSALLDRLQARGLVRRERGRPDRRFVRVTLTKAGGMLAAAAPEPAQGRLLHGLASMPAASVRRIRRAVDALVGAMEATNVEAPFFFADP